MIVILGGPVGDSRSIYVKTNVTGLVSKQGKKQSGDDTHDRTVTLSKGASANKDDTLYGWARAIIQKMERSEDNILTSLLMDDAQTSRHGAKFMDLYCVNGDTATREKVTKQLFSGLPIVNVTTREILAIVLNMVDASGDDLRGVIDNVAALFSNVKRFGPPQF